MQKCQRFGQCMMKFRTWGNTLSIKVSVLLLLCDCAVFKLTNRIKLLQFNTDTRLWNQLVCNGVSFIWSCTRVLECPLHAALTKAQSAERLSVDLCPQGISQSRKHMTSYGTAGDIGIPFRNPSFNVRLRKMIQPCRLMPDHKYNFRIFIKIYIYFFFKCICRWKCCFMKYSPLAACSSQRVKVSLINSEYFLFFLLEEQRNSAANILRLIHGKESLMLTIN